MGVPSTVRSLAIGCLPHRKRNLFHHVHVIVFRRELDRLSHKAAVGEVAHEFAHLVSFLDRGIDAEISPSKEEEADSLAISWGFQEEIQANKTELERLYGKGTQRHRG